MGVVVSGGRASGEGAHDVGEAVRRRRPWLIGAVAVLLFLSLAAWVVSSPVGSSPDDDYHLAMTYCAADAAECTDAGARVGYCFAMQPLVSADCSLTGTQTVPRAEGVVQGHYPPFYYAYASVFVGDTLATSTLHIRLANSLLAVAMALGSIALTARPLRRAVALSWLVVSVPMAMFFIASINPNSWSIIGIAALWGPLLSLLTAPGGGGATFGAGVSMRVALARIGFIVLAAFISVAGRTEGALFLPIIAVTLAVFAIPRHPLAERRSLARLVVPATPLVLSILFLVLFAGSKAGVSPSGTAAPGERYRGWNVVQHTVNSMLGHLGMPGIPGATLGIYDVPVPAIAAVAAVAAAGGVVLLGLGVMYGRKALALALYVSLVFALIAVLWSRVPWEYFQPRYFIPLAFVGVGLCLLPRPLVETYDRPLSRLADGDEVAGDVVEGDGGAFGEGGFVEGDDGAFAEGAGHAADSTPVITRLQLLVVVLAVAVANSATLMSTLIRYVRGVIAQPSRDPLNVLAPSIDPAELAGRNLPVWWPPQVLLGPLGVWIAGSLTFTGAVLLVWWWLSRDNEASADAAILDASVDDEWNEGAVPTPVTPR